MRNLKWFFGEFFVVVSGVLVAFLLNGWWMNIKEAEKEREYLRLIRTDLQTTIGHVEDASDAQRNTLHAASQLLKFSYMEVSPPEEKIGQTIFQSMNFSPSYQISATLSSLVNTGELSLIQDDSLRNALGELVSRLAEYTNSNNEMAYSWLVPAFERFASVVNVADMRYQMMGKENLEMMAVDSLSGYPHPENLALPDPVDLQALIREKEFKNTIILLQVAQSNLYRLHIGFLEELNRTNALLEKEIEKVQSVR